MDELRVILVGQVGILVERSDANEKNLEIIRKTILEKSTQDLTVLKKVIDFLDKNLEKVNLEKLSELKDEITSLKKEIEMNYFQHIISENPIQPVGMELVLNHLPII